MKHAETVFQLAIGLLVALVLFSSFAIVVPDKTALIVGVPSACKSRMALEAPKSVDVYAGSTQEIIVKVKTVACGASHIRLFVDGVPKELYAVGPSSYPVLSPGKEANFTVVFDIPESDADKIYTGIYRLDTNEGKFSFAEVTINVLTPEKPKAEIKAVAMTSKEYVVTSGADKRLWYGIGFLATVLAIILIGVEYFEVHKKHEYQGAIKRTDEGIDKGLGTAPMRKEKFESALKKGKKR